MSEKYIVPIRSCFKCGCGKAYTQAYNLRRHQKLECGQKPRFTCHLCNYSLFGYPLITDPHGYFNCSTCFKRYTHRSSAMRHVKYECGKGPQFRCRYCPKLFTQRSFVKDAKSGLFVCLTCTKRYKRRAGVREHLKHYCQTDARYVCDLCKRVFKRPKYYAIESDTKLYACLKCMKKYKSRGGISQHVHYECGISPQFCCERCEKTFARPLMCSRCGKHYKTKSTLKQHLKECGLRPQFSCHLCAKNFFLQFRELRPRFSCNKCGRSYKHSRHLTAHLKYECGKEPGFACQMCHKKFFYKYTMNAHLRGSTDWYHVLEKSFPCDTCGRAYKYRGGLTQHKKYFCMREKKLECEIPDCTYKTNRVYDLSRHMRKKHKIHHVE
ncbi:zinc finger protein 425-like [Cylas formicarius]|uniref:zinc finger protein 425-like n=1 Tax=Cylas formicarius TaxID=197179 RepID=UPI002958764A|nr:zinc finger protein 425-like [Cylas formicarius]